jgi:SAM-dependent methyltransferase
MYLKDLQKTWNSFGENDPLWAILTESDKKNGKWNKEDFFKSGEQEIDSIVNYVEKLKVNIKNEKALDFGCGVGRLSQALAKYFNEVTGVDIAQSMIEMAGKYNAHKDKCKYILNTDSDLKRFPDNNFDFIYSNIVLQHINPKYSVEYISEFVRVLSSGGVLIFQLPAEKMPLKSLKALVRRLLPDSLVYYIKRKVCGKVMEMHCVKKDDVLALLQKVGAKVLDVVEDEGESAKGFLSYRYCVTK